MLYRPRIYKASHWIVSFMSGLALISALCLSPRVAPAQDRDRDRDRDYRYQDRDRDRYFSRLEAGTTIPVRTNETIDVDRMDRRVYTGVVDRDVRDNNDRLVIPRDSSVELMVRVAPDNDLILDLESIVVNGQRYAIRAEPNRVESQRDNSLVGAIVGAINGVQVRGRAVRIPRDSVVTFRLERPLDMGVPDPGYTRDGIHYHDRDRYR